jgi:predicted NBD/HSP70 family sugar kinase
MSRGSEETRRALPSSVRVTKQDVLRELLREARSSLRKGREPEGRSVAALEARLEVSATTVRSLLSHAEPVVVASSDDAERRRSGRRGPFAGVYRIEPAIACVVAVQFGHDLTRVGVYDLHGRELPLDRHPWRGSQRPEARAPAAALDAAAEIAEELWRRAGVPEVVGVGVSVAGSVDPADGTVRDRSGLVGWGGIDPLAELRSRLGWDCAMEIANDASLAALAEHWWGAAAGAHDSFYLEWSEGIGGGIIVAGRPYSGAHGAAGEFGHQRVVEGSPGELCPRCDRHGCLESFVSEAPLCRRAGADLSAADLAQRLDAGDVDAHVAVREAALHIGHALGAVVNVLDPDMVVVGGSIGRTAYRHVRDAMVRGLTERYLAAGQQRVRIVKARRGAHAVLEGERRTCSHATACASCSSG